MSVCAALAVCAGWGGVVSGCTVSYTAGGTQDLPVRPAVAVTESAGQHTHQIRPNLGLSCLVAPATVVATACPSLNLNVYINLKVNISMQSSATMLLVTEPLCISHVLMN